MKNILEHNICRIESIKAKLDKRDRLFLTTIIEKVQTKYQRRATLHESNDLDENNKEKLYYNYGIADGLNHAMKIIDGIFDDYLDGVEEL